MTSSTHTLSPLRQRMIDDMRMRKLSPKTQSSYIRVVKRSECVNDFETPSWFI